MWHRIEFVAESRRLDQDALKAFAIKWQDTYGVVIEGDNVEVNTWYVDMLINDFRVAQNTVQDYVKVNGSASHQTCAVGPLPGRVQVSKND